jgi:8-oxo-dGTP pyrophosphatase MutT (NUDIX family)
VGDIVHSDAMSGDASNGRDPRLIAVRSTTRTRQAPAQFVRLSQLRKLCECEQVAAVCYRVRKGTIEFLLVRTRGGGCWTFPKGSAEPGLTHAQAAALEAFEEAGVHGRIEEASFARYRRRRGHARNHASSADENKFAVNAHLCEVLRLGPPQESRRDRTWFSVEDARQRLHEGRKNDGGAEFARVIDRAVARIQRLRGRIGMVADRPQADRPQADPPQQDRLQLDSPQKDALQRVQFDFAEAYGRAEEASFMPYAIRQLGDMRRSSVPIVDVHFREVLPCEVLEIVPAREKKPKALETGAKTG